MPVTLHTTFGKAPYEVTENFKVLAAAIGDVEAKIGSIRSAAGVDRLRVELQQLTARVDTLARQVQALQAAP